MADLSMLGGLNAIEPLDSSDYPVNQEKDFRLAPKGTYTVQAPDGFPQAAFGKTKNGDLSVQIDPTIVDGPSTGLTIKFTKVSAKPFKRGEKWASQVGDYLAACGWTGQLTDPQSIADAIESTAGKVYQVKLDWRAYNKRTGFSLEGMERFPKLADGTYQSYVIDPSEIDHDASKAAGKVVGKKDPDTGKELRVYANLQIPFGGFVSATN
jgi:hypothetical protein